jgi:UDP-N-acetylglucosamine--N-acetylmuramyl-(pentapeptide) pyrophosphoryl-undecaprenol N-acetylglucosamine transferase
MGLRPNLKNLISLIKSLSGVAESLAIILRFQPQVVVGFGGYATFPLVFFAKILGKKTIIHEQNVVAGLANRCLAAFADKIALSFNQTRVYFIKYNDKAVFTGNPLRRDFSVLSKKEALDFLGLSEDRFTVLVMGGSQGSSKINTVILQVLMKMQDKINIQLIHLSGSGDFARLEASYKKIGIPFKLAAFLKPMHYAYSAADLAVTRSGATTVTELIFFRLPAIIIPYPFAYQHQLANARILSDKGAAILIADSALTPDLLEEVITGLMRNRNKVNEMRLRYQNIAAESYQSELSQLALSLL